MRHDALTNGAPRSGSSVSTGTSSITLDLDFPVHLLEHASGVVNPPARVNTMTDHTLSLPDLHVPSAAATYGTTTAPYSHSSSPTPSLSPFSSPYPLCPSTLAGGDMHENSINSHENNINSHENNINTHENNTSYTTTEDKPSPSTQHHAYAHAHAYAHVYAFSGIGAGMDLSATNINTNISGGGGECLAGMDPFVLSFGGITPSGGAITPSGGGIPSGNGFSSGGGDVEVPRSGTRTEGEIEQINLGTKAAEIFEVMELVAQKREELYIERYRRAGVPGY